jgi:hypothetical protein
MKRTLQNTRFHLSWVQRGVYGLQPLGTRQWRGPTFAEVLHFETCNAQAPYSAVNCQVPPQVPVWQYVDRDDIAAAARKSAGRTL